VIFYQNFRKLKLQKYISYKAWERLPFFFREKTIIDFVLISPAESALIFMTNDSISRLS
jgi:hypothetical protein